MAKKRFSVLFVDANGNFHIWHVVAKDSIEAQHIAEQEYFDELGLDPEDKDVSNNYGLDFLDVLKGHCKSAI